MNIRELRQLIHDLPDDMEVEFGVDGTVYAIGANITVKEWNTIYFGVDKEDLTESMIEWEMSADEDDEGPSELDELTPEDREAFMEQMAKEDPCVGEVCTVPPNPQTKGDKELAPETEMM